ncbi:hypothetical protein [Emcibacter sp. SYSU 3D8]|uniref:hypothetical protein n=1 Tax=Emcibacter sp. SYSU 3D8 TaxID=3133969 RepID=UPI0031FEDEB8
MKVGSFFPDRPLPTLYAMAADDLPLHFDMDKLTDKQKADHYEQNQLLAMLQSALLSISKPADYVALFDAFSRPPWNGYLRNQHDMAAKAGAEMVPLDHLLYAPVETYYETIAGMLPDVELLTLLMISRSNQVLHKDQGAIERMLKLNSKFHFAENAPLFGIPTPETIIARQPLSGNRQVEDFFAKHGNRIILKMTGQPGARSVKAVASTAEGDEYLKGYRPDDQVLVQQRLELEKFDEWTADLLITEDTVTLDNVRRILVTDGLWIGNLIHADPPITPSQTAELLKVGAYARKFGFGTETGDCLGIDYFIGQDGEVVVTEINPRWTAGLFPTQVLRRVNKARRDAVPYFELVRLEDYDKFQAFCARHLPNHAAGDFAVMPLGFSPYEREIDGVKRVFTWMVVIGDFPAFRKAAKDVLGESGLPNGDLVPL